MDTISMLMPLLNFLVYAGILSSFICNWLRHRYRYIAVSVRTGCIFKKKLLVPNPSYRNNGQQKGECKYNLLQSVIIFHFKWRLLNSSYLIFFWLFFQIFPFPASSLHVCKYTRHFQHFKLCTTRVSICIHKITSNFISIKEC